jgi:glutaredoxin
MKLTLETAEALVREKTGAKNIFVFAKSYCPFCVKTKKLLDSKAVPFEYYELDKELSEGKLSVKNIGGSLVSSRIFLKKCSGAV